MNDPISAGRPTPRPAPAPTAPTTRAGDAPGLDQAAAEFASLLGAEQDRSAPDPTARTDGQPETDRPRTDHERVEEKRGGDQQEGGESGEGDQGSQGGQGEAPRFGDAILQAFSIKEPPAAVATGVEAPPADLGASLDNIVQQVADRVLVTAPGAGQAEVRIFLKDSVLPGAEIRITQNAGQLQVTMVTDSPRSAELLAQNQASLQQRLTDRLAAHDVVVSVELGGDPQPDQDGRSRQRRDLYEETRE